MKTKTNKDALLQGRTTEKIRTAVVEYAKDNELSVSKAIEELVLKGLKA